MFHFGGFPSCNYEFITGSLILHQGGCPIRKSTDIALICSSPWLIAACHVLLRLLMPRHSPYALSSLNLLVLSCLSFANNCSVVFTFLPPFRGKIAVLLPTISERPFRDFSRFFLLTQLSVRFLSLPYSVFNDHLCNPFRVTGGDEGIRTLDPLLAGQVLSQLSYTPERGFRGGNPRKLNNEKETESRPFGFFY